MKNIALLLTSIALLLFSSQGLADINVKQAEAKTGVSLEEFMQLPMDKRIELCAQVVNAEAIGECVSLRPPKNKPTAHLSDEVIMNAIYQCERDMKTADAQQLVACARDRLNAGTQPDRPVVTDAQIKKAEEYCGQRYSSSIEFGSCVSGILRHIDHQGVADGYQ